MARLTKRAVEGAKATGKGWSWLGDDEVPGFGVRVYPSGRKVYSLRYRNAAGRQRMLKLGQHGELTVEEARNKARREKVRVLEGEDPLAEREKERTGIQTVGGLMNRWIEDYAKAHRRRWTEDRRRANARIRPALGKTGVTELTVEKLAAWHRRLGKESPVEANRCLETLRAAWRWASSHGLLPEGAEDPTGRIKRFRETGRDRWLRKEELEALMEETRKHPDPYIRAAIPLLLLTGLRKGELLSARWEDVDLERAEIRLRETKTGEPQVRLLPSPAVEILRDLPRAEASPWVFPSPTNGKEHRRDLKKPWDKIRTDAGLADVTLHDLRRTAGSFMAQAGVPLQVIQHVLGHSHPGVTRLYARLASENERDALETLAGELGGILNGAPSTNGSDPEPANGTDLRNRLEGLLDGNEDPGTLAERLRTLAAAVENGGG